MAGAYTVFANGGVHLKPWMLASVRNANGDIVSDYSPEAKQVMDPRAAYLTQSLLEGVMNYGTAAAVRRRGFTAPAAGKTGTSHDAWFAGYTSNLICIVWVGNDDYTDVKIEGAHAAAPIWAEFMKRAIQLPQYSDVKSFSPPEGITVAQHRPRLRPAGRLRLPRPHHVRRLPRRHGAHRLLQPDEREPTELLPEDLRHRRTS